MPRLKHARKKRKLSYTPCSREMTSLLVLEPWREACESLASGSPASILQAPVLNPFFNPVLNPVLNLALNPVVNPVVKPVINPVLNLPGRLPVEADRPVQY
jgi:hypothetical protein